MRPLLLVLREELKGPSTNAVRALPIARTLRVDPSRTNGIRRRWLAEVNKQFNLLQKAVREFIVKEDALGLAKVTTQLKINADPRRYAFQTDAQKLSAFQAWLQEQTDKGILSKSSSGKYIDSAYKQGIIRAYLEKHRAGKNLTKTPGWYSGTQEAFLARAFGAGEAVGKVQLLATRTYETLKGMTGAMASQTARVLSEGMVRGDGAVDVGRALAERIEVSRSRALTIARTELMHAHAEGQLDGFKELGIQELDVMAEWSTAGDDRVCPICAALEGKVYTVEEARGMIPQHPNCRCTWIPSNKPATKPPPPTTPKPPPTVPDPSPVFPMPKPAPAPVLPVKGPDVPDTWVALNKQLDVIQDAVDKAQATRHAWFVADADFHKKLYSMADLQQHRLANPLSPLGGQLKASATAAQQAEWKKLVAEYEKHMAAQATLPPSINYSAVRAEAHKVLLAEKAPTKLAYEVTKTQVVVPPITATRIESGARFVDRLLGRRVTGAINDYWNRQAFPNTKPFPVFVANPQSGIRRAYFDEKLGIFLSQQSDVSTVIHEFIHAVEYARPDIAKKTKAFLMKRAGVGPDGRAPLPKSLNALTKSNAYRSTEVALEDQWYARGGTHYTGRVYYGDVATEILTTGVERLYNDPISFRRSDREFFDFVVSTLKDLDVPNT